MRLAFDFFFILQ